jgi:hypothetical protein
MLACDRTMQPPSEAPKQNRLMQQWNCCAVTIHYEKMSARYWARLHLLLQGEVLSDLWGRRHYGLAPDNVIIMPQPAWPGHRYDRSSQRWVRDPLGPSNSLGTGGCWGSRRWG